MKKIVRFLLGAAAVAVSFLPGVGQIAGGLLASFLLTMGVSLAASVLTPSVQRQAQMLDNVLDELAALPVVYGKTRVGVKLVDVRTAGTDNEFLYLVCALCHGSSDGSGIEAIEEIYFDDKLAVDASGNIQSPFSADVLGFSKYSGSTSQSADSLMTSTFGTGTPVPWPSTSKGLGVAYIVFQMKYDTGVYTGIPQITVVVKGAKVYDPRTGGSFAYSTNPALCLYDYLTSTRYGGSVPGGEIDTATFNAMANYYDQTISIPNPYPTGGTTTTKRFETNGALDTAASIEQNVQMLLSACRGNLVYQGGAFRLITRQGGMSSSLNLTEDDILGDWSFSIPGVGECPNYTTYEWVSADDNYAGKSARWPAPGVANSYLTADNGMETVRTVSCPLTTNRYVAEQIAVVELQEARDGLQVQVTCTLAAMQVQIGEVVGITHATPGWSTKLFWVMGLAFNPNGPSVRLSLLEYNNAAYTVSAQTQAVPSANTNLADPTYTAPYPVLPPETGQDDGAEKRKMLKGYQTGTAQDGDSITFSPAYQNVPKTRVYGGATYNSALTSPMYEDKQFVSLTPAGGTIRAKLRSPGSPTTRNQDFAGSLLDAPGDTPDSLTTSNAPASNDQYTVRTYFNLAIQSKYAGSHARITVEWAIDSSFDSGSNWTQRASLSQSLTDPTILGETNSGFIDTVITVPGLDSTDKIRVRFVAVTITGAYQGTPVAEVRGANNGTYAGRGVTYVTSTDTTVAATTASQKVTWEAWDA